MDKIQLIFFFISGFLVSRLIIRVKLPQRIVFNLLGKRQLSLSHVLFYIVMLATVFSFFIPNVITVLTLLPILELLRKSYKDAGVPVGNIATMLALATIYGANIGGMGSITATPANGILATYAEINKIPGSEHLNFASWLAWGVPLIICFSFLAWLILILVFRPNRYSPQKIRFPFPVSEISHRYQTLTIWLTGIFFVSSLALSATMLKFENYRLTTLIVTGVLSVFFTLFLFVIPLPNNPEKGQRRPLLKISDCYSNLPMRGFLFIGIAILLAAILYFLDINRYVAAWISRMIPGELSEYTLFLGLALVTSFATEILSNTAVQISIFVIAQPLAETLGFPPLLALIVTTLSSTSAFMSPIATGVNGLAFGGVRGVSFTKMLLVGFLMNIAGALLISGWAVYFIAWLYHLI